MTRKNLWRLLKHLLCQTWPIRRQYGQNAKYINMIKCVWWGDRWGSEAAAMERGFPMRVIKYHGIWLLLHEIGLDKPLSAAYRAAGKALPFLPIRMCGAVLCPWAWFEWTVLVDRRSFWKLRLQDGMSRVLAGGRPLHAACLQPRACIPVTIGLSNTKFPWARFMRRHLSVRGRGKKPGWRNW